MHPKQIALLAAKGDEEDSPGGMRLNVGEGSGHFQDYCCPGGIVVCAGKEHSSWMTEVVSMGSDDHGFWSGPRDHPYYID